MYSLRIENLISEKSNIYTLVVAAAQLARDVAGAAIEQGLKPTTKALTDIADGYAQYDFKK